MKRNFICLAALLLLMSCGSKQAKSPDKAEAPIGASDAAQGYTYSKVLDKKIRIFEEGARVLSATDPQATMAGYVVFPSDSSKAEVFLPQETVVLDKRVRPDGTAVWNVEDDDTYMLEKCGNEWLVSRGGKVLYASTGCENQLKAECVGAKGEKLSAVFFTQAGVAQIRYNGIDYLLRQYVTASGYGYRNPLADIRGKGQQVTLSLAGNDTSIDFVEQK